MAQVGFELTNYTAKDDFELLLPCNDVQLAES